MSSLSDMVSTAIAGLLSAALVHFGATDGTDKTRKHPTPTPASANAAHARTNALSQTLPVPTDDDRFAPANPDLAPKSRPISGRPIPDGHAT